jgi:hypothetical protein
MTAARGPHHTEWIGKSRLSHGSILRIWYLLSRLMLSPSADRLFPDARPSLAPPNPDGVEPICTGLPIAPSTYFLWKAQRQD